ncbi:anti-sigma factor [Microbacter sp. GSS18]|nr:anti-sigma factor [Microbacter sp. GSS18]
MSHIDPDRIALVALGEPMSVDESTHVEQCDDCTIDLFELRRTVIVGRSTIDMDDLESPPDRVWDRIAAEIAGLPEATEESDAEEAEPLDAATSPSDGSVAEPATAAPAPEQARGRGRVLTRALFGLAAGTAVILALVGVWSLVRPAQVVEVAAATLAAFPDHPDAEGSAIVIEENDGEQLVRVELDTDEADDGFREVWLITADASALVSLGVLEGREGEFVVPDGIDIHEYVLVDVSQEPLDGDPAHSGDSIVRGELDFA